MDEIPIIYSKDINTGAIGQIRSVGNVLLSTNGSLNDLTDVDITTPTDNQVVKYNSATSKWINDKLGLGDLLNVSIASLAIGDYLRYNGLLWQNSQRQYITINMYGTTTTTLHSTTSPKPIMQFNASYWQAPIPNPTTSVNSSMTSSITPFSSVFDTATGFITLNANKRFMITATINQGGVNLNASCQTELSIYNASSGSAVAFSPNYTNIGRMDIDFAGMGITTSAVVSGVSKIVIMFRYLTAQSTGLNPNDTNINVSIVEI
jgi:hypothetical protein